MCSAPLECCELDHICPLATQTHCAKQVLQALCPTCHRSRTDSSEHRPENPILSHYSPYTYEAFLSGALSRHSA